MSTALAEHEYSVELRNGALIVVADREIVKPGELPSTWGLMVPHGSGLRVDVEAPALRDLTPTSHRDVRAFPPNFGRSFLAALLRSACAVGDVTPEEIAAARDDARKQEAESQRKFVGELEAMHTEFRERVSEFGQAAGVRFGTSWGRHTPREVGLAVRAVLDGSDQARVQEGRLQRIATEARAIADYATDRLAEMKPEAPA